MEIGTGSVPEGETVLVQLLSPDHREPQAPQVVEGRKTTDEAEPEKEAAGTSTAAGSFAKILAGLLGRTAARESAAAESESAATALAAEDAGPSDSATGDSDLVRIPSGEVLANLMGNSGLDFDADTEIAGEDVAAEVGLPAFAAVALGQISGGDVPPEETADRPEPADTAANVRGAVQDRAGSTGDLPSSSGFRVGEEQAGNSDSADRTDAMRSDAVRPEAIAGQAAADNPDVRDNFAVIGNPAAGRKASVETAGIAGAVPSVDAKRVSGEDGRAEDPRARLARRGSRTANVGRAEGTETRTGTETAFKVPGVESSRAEAELSGREAGIQVRLVGENPGSRAAAGWEVRSGQSFEGLLARELHQHLNADIVREARVLLRDGNEGTIRLALKPETLGNVKIRLEMAENKISGHVVVESEEAMKAFRQELAALEREFLDSGFLEAKLSMSFSGEGGPEGRAEPGKEDGLSGRLAASRYDASALVAEEGGSVSYGTGTVNLLA